MSWRGGYFIGHSIFQVGVLFSAAYFHNYWSILFMLLWWVSAEMVSERVKEWQRELRASLAQQGEAVAWQYRYKSEGPNGFTYNTFVHPITGMGRDADAIDWWVLGVKPRPAGEVRDGP